LNLLLLHGCPPPPPSSPMLADGLVVAPSATGIKSWSEDGRAPAVVDITGSQWASNVGGVVVDVRGHVRVTGSNFSNVRPVLPVWS
jgi:hypothetical protein